MFSIYLNLPAKYNYSKVHYNFSPKIGQKIRVRKLCEQIRYSQFFHPKHLQLIYVNVTLGSCPQPYPFLRCVTNLFHSSLGDSVFCKFSPSARPNEAKLDFLIFPVVIKPYYWALTSVKFCPSPRTLISCRQFLTPSISIVAILMLSCHRARGLIGQLLGDYLRTFFLGARPIEVVGSWQIVQYLGHHMAALIYDFIVFSSHFLFLGHRFS